MKPDTVLLERYEIGPEIAFGGMATVRLARARRRPDELVAVKQIHPHLAKEPSFVDMFLDEARLARAIDHPNVVRVIDLVRGETEVALVLEYVHGVTLRALFDVARERREALSAGMVSAIAQGLLAGLDAAHQARDDAGRPLEIVHRDVSPQNVLVSRWGVPKLTDFGVAKATERLQTTRDGQIKGKVAYMAPEQLIGGQPIDARADIYAAGVVLWELVTGRRLFEGAQEPEMMMKIVTAAIDPPSEVAAVDPRWDALLERALAVSPERRYPRAAAMAEAIAAVFPPVPAAEVAAWVREHAADELDAMEVEGRAFLRRAPPPASRAGRRTLVALAGGAMAAAAAALLLNAGASAGSTTSPIASSQLAPSQPIALPAPPPAAASAPAPAAPARPQARPLAKPPPRCASPFYTDDEGVVRVRRECL